jgi:2-methylcitrate dehydratase PrpD
VRRYLPRQFPAVLRVRLKDGRELEERVDANRGGPGNPLSADELATKFRLNAARVLPAEVSTRITELTYGLAGLGDLTELTGLLRT